MGIPKKFIFTIFCLTHLPLSKLLNDSNRGYKIDKLTINNLFYMDGVKLYAKNDNVLKSSLEIVKDFSDGVGIEFGLDKCAKTTSKVGKFVKSSNIVLDICMKNLQDKVYKYLGIQEGNGI